MVNIEILKKPIANDITETIGNTPLVRLNKINDTDAEVLVKIESFNPVNSVKDRVAASLIDEAEKQGKINKDTTIIEPTSGNTGIGLGYVTAAKGYKLIITMPESMSIERRKLIKVFGADIRLTPASDGMSGAVKEAERLHAEIENSFIPQQFENEANTKIHEQTTAQEILKDTDGKVDIVVAGVGTGGTLMGISNVLKKENPNFKSIAIEPAGSPLLTTGKGGPHKIQGIGPGFIPGLIDVDNFDEIVTVEDQDAKDTLLKLAREEGIFAGISSGAAVFAALREAKKEENKGKRIIAILPDTGERYLSVGWVFDDLFDD